MKIIDNAIVIDLKNKDKEHLLINSLNGLVDVIYIKEFSVFKSWIGLNDIVPKDEFELNLYNLLVNRGYILSTENEKKIKEDLINKLYHISQERFNNCSNATFVLTYKCNFSCPYCYEKKIHNNEKMTKDMVDSIFDLYPNGIKNIGLFGGEPLLLDNKEIIEYIISKSPKSLFSLITNGYNLIEYLDILKSININEIQVTLDGAQNTHNKSRTLISGKHTYDKIMEGISLFLKNKIRIKIRMNVTNDNIQECIREKERIFELFYDYKDILTFELQPLFQYGYNERNMLYSKLMFSDKQSKSNNEILSKLSRISQFLYNGKRLIPSVKACDLEESNKYFDAKGDIYTCLVAVGHQKRSIGKYFPKYELKQNGYHSRTILSIEKCKTCKFALLCGGGCPNAVPEDNIMSPNCSSIINEVNNTIPFIYNNFKKI